MSVGDHVFGFRTVAVLAGVVLTVPLGAAAAGATPARLITDPAAYVDPFIGTTNSGNTYPGAVTPFGMLAFSPQTSRGNQVATPAPGGYQYTATRIRGFSLTHLSGVGCSGGNGDIPIMPQVGAITSSPTADTTDAVYASTFAHANEAASPGYYRVGLDSGAGAELTVTPRTGYGRFTFPADKPASLLFRTSMSETGSTDASVHIDPSSRTVSGSVTAGNFCGPQSANNRKAYYTLHFVATLDQPFAETGTWTDATLARGGTDARGGSGYSGSGRPVAGKGSGGYVTFAPGTTTVGVRVAISYVSAGGAQANLSTESPATLPFETMAADARAAWTRRLRQIEIGGGTEAQQTTFYTALYHAQLEPTLTSDADGRYLGADGAVHAVRAPQQAQYGTFSGWDVYRAQVQLLALLDTRMASDFAQSLYNYAGQRDGEWDRWLLQHGKTSVMSGDPSAAAIAGMYAFGARDFDVRGAYESLVRAATVPTANDDSDAGCPVECVGQRPALDRYLTLGYVPADDCHCWGGAAETLEDAAADYGLSQLAGALGDTGGQQRFLARSHNWRHVFDPTAQADPGLAHNVREQIDAITASGENAPYEGKAQGFDGDKGTKWLTFATTGWLQARLKTPLTVTNYALTSANDEPGRDPRDWLLLGSADGQTWSPVDARTGQRFTERGQTREFTVAEPKPYRYYRLDVTANSGADIVQLAEVELADPAVPTPAPADGSFVGWMRDRYADGHWAGGFSPSTGTGFVEGSSAQYTWMVYSDVVGLAAAMGGPEVAVRRLDAFFRNPDGSFDLSATKATRFDATNEPDIQTPYQYAYLGAAARTQETVHAIITRLWTDGTGGIPGNDDAGTMSAWYVFSALGLYPVVPTRAELALTTPVFPRAVLRLDGGRTLTIDAPRDSAEAIYIQRLSVDGDHTTRSWLPASAVTTGGHLIYTLSTAPSLTWGSGPGDAPPQN
ncbi:putative alpha-1,2-mannosidase [Krasilnikovia cinnamomea]|uniref:Putative alpha-1,2-mannosidase n=2 Tax=Krasilnikovia cinnamomea TaxID=349313 RepID=A0A4Q7ZNB5_9ACTN|nr:putative alpha-1,2-mannosidase [Krasilnikovia cinnamomea]